MYIRTKNSVYKIDEIKPYFLDEKQKLFINNELKIAANEKQVIKQADTIEELCDCFVTESPSVELKYRFNIYKTLNGAKKCAYANGDEINIYGHIWNGVTLTPVAKLNREGELELL